MYSEDDCGLVDQRMNHPCMKVRKILDPTEDDASYKRTAIPREIQATMALRYRQWGVKLRPIGL